MWWWQDKLTHWQASLSPLLCSCLLMWRTSARLSGLPEGTAQDRNGSSQYMRTSKHVQVFTVRVDQKGIPFWSTLMLSSRLIYIDFFVIEAHCYIVQYRRIDCEQWRSRINQFTTLAIYIGLHQLHTKLFCMQLTKAYTHGWNILQSVDLLILLRHCSRSFCL